MNRIHYRNRKLLSIEHDKVAFLFHVQLNINESRERKSLQIDIFIVDSVPIIHHEDTASYFIGMMVFGSLTESIAFCILYRRIEID